MSTKHKPWRIRAGEYNYRGFNFVKVKPSWVLPCEDGGAYHREPTIDAMCRYIDRNYKELSKS